MPPITINIGGGVIIGGSGSGGGGGGEPPPEPAAWELTEAETDELAARMACHYNPATNPDGSVPITYPPHELTLARLREIGAGEGAAPSRLEAAAVLVYLKMTDPCPA